MIIARLTPVVANFFENFIQSLKLHSLGDGPLANGPEGAPKLAWRLDILAVHDRFNRDADPASDGQGYRQLTMQLQAFQRIVSKIPQGGAQPVRSADGLWL
ncbi:MAG: hypothetical protein V5B36_16345 [Candidatus Accumulibacter sp. UW25]